MAELPLRVDGAGASGWGPVARRAFVRAMFIMVLIAAVAVAVGAWWVQQGERVLSRSAVVRGDLAMLGTRFNGMLLSAEIEPGQRVRSGQVLGRLDDRHLRAQESEAAAQVQALEREIELERAAIAQDRSTRRVRVQEAAARARAAQGEIRAAQLRAEEAEAYRRVRRNLADEGIISAEAMREANSRVSLALESLGVSISNGTAVDSAVRNSELELSGMALREQRLGVLQAQLAAGRARLAQVRADLDSAQLTAPADGTVVRWLIHAGGSVEVGKPVLSFSRGSKRWVEAWIDEDVAARIKPGDAVTVTMPFQPGRELQGTVARIGITTEVDPATLNPLEPRPTRIRLAPVVPVEVALPDLPDSLPPGLSAIVAIRTSAR